MFFSACAYIGKKMHPPILGGSSINVMVHPIPRHPALLLYEYNTCVEPRRLKVLTPESVIVPVRDQLQKKKYINIYADRIPVCVYAPMYVELI